MPIDPAPSALPLCVVTAADIEYKTVAKFLQDAVLHEIGGLRILRGHFANVPVALMRTEIGAPGFVERLQEHFASQTYAALLVIGLAGALAPELKTGDLVLYDQCLDGRAQLAPANRKTSSSRDDFASILCDRKLGARLLAHFTKAGQPCVSGNGVLVEKVLIEAQQKAALYALTQAAAVDMETWLVLKAAAQYEIPCAALRIVMDEAAHDLPDFNAGLTPAGQVRLGATLRAFARRPLAAMRFIKTLRPALTALSRATHNGLTALTGR